MALLIYIPLILLVWLPIILYYWAFYINTYWKRKNVPYIPASLFFGNLKKAFTFQKTVALQVHDLYNDTNTKDNGFVGIHIFHKPTILAKDPELIKRFLVKDFNYFSNRHSNSDPNSDALGGRNLFFLRNPLWKQLRNRLTPMFTSGKLKQMFYLMKDVGTDLNTALLSMNISEKTKSYSVEIKDLCAKYTTDVIATCAYGVHANSLTDPDSEFRKNGRKVFDTNFYRVLEFISFFFLPEVISYFRFTVFSREAGAFLRNFVNYVIQEREQNGNVRNDLIDTLITLKNEDINKYTNNNEIVFKGDTLAAQVCIFFTAGFETSSSTMSFGLYELSLQVDLQVKLRQEIKETLTKNKELTYDIVQNMPYLNMVILEILRMYPPLPFLDRICTLPNEEKGYSLEPFDNFMMPEGMPVLIPIYSLQRDPKYFPNPNKFDPDRFAPANIDKIIPYTYMPFGKGPHSCIAERFGLLQVKIGLIHFLQNHYVTLSDKMQKKMILEKRAFFLTSEGGIYLNIFKDPLLEE